MPALAEAVPVVAAHLSEVAAQVRVIVAQVPKVAAQVPAIAAQVPEVAAQVPEVAAQVPEVGGQGEGLRVTGDGVAHDGHFCSSGGVEGRCGRADESSALSGWRRVVATPDRPCAFPSLPAANLLPIWNRRNLKPETWNSRTLPFDD